KSYNSQIGVALSLWQLDDNHELAIIEAGVSKPGEMEVLHRMIQPDIAVLTTVGPAHDDGFVSRDAKIREKLILFNGADQAVYSPDDTAGIAVPGHGRQLTWGRRNAELTVLGYSVTADNRCVVRARYDGRDVAIDIP